MSSATAKNKELSTVELCLVLVVKEEVMCPLEQSHQQGLLGPEFGQNSGKNA